MPLIDKTYFVGELNIPDTNNASVSERLTFLIAKYEDQLLRALLGNALYAAYKTGIAVTPTPAAKWTELRDGKDYTDANGNAQYWMGFANTTTKQSLIANYVYYWWSRDKVSHTSGVGETVTNTDGAVRISPAEKQARAWNEMADQVCELVRFLNENAATYTEWDSSHGYCVLEEFSPINTFNL